MNETFSVIWSIVTGGLIVPAVTWMKTKLPPDFPIQSVLVAAVLNLVVASVLAHFLAPEMTWEQIVNFALVGQVSSQGVHAVLKTGRKNVITNGGNQG